LVEVAAAAVKLWQFWHYGNYGNPVRGFGFDVQLPNYQLTKLPNSSIGQCCFDYKIDSRIKD
jgi:hypothetical protein